MKLEKRIGLAGGTAIVVGGVIGMGAYALVPSIAQKAGNAAWLAMTIAMLVSVVSVLPLIQISSALPVAGGGYMYASYFLTGENRIYERFGQHGAQFARNVPYTNFFLVPGCVGLAAR